jgi:DNA-binding response OmpR family regulator
MLRIHRRQPVVRIGKQTVNLTGAEHALITALGMMDNKVTPSEILLEILSEGRVQISADRKVLWTRLAVLRRKIGRERLQSRRSVGYILVGDVQFYG